MRSVIQLGVMLATTAGVVNGMLLSVPAADVLYEAQMVFDPADGSHGHVHASCVTQT